MNGKHLVHNLIILDESGSMQSIKEPVIGMFNSIVTSSKEIASKYPEQEHLVSMVSFNSLGVRTYLYSQPLISLDVISGQNYRPRSMTPLYDAMGFSIGRLRKEVETIPDYNVLVNILTDGFENASKEYTGNSIRNLIDELKKTGKWTFTYAGADHDVEEAASRMSISNYISFNKSEHGLHSFLQKEVRARHMLHQKLYKRKSVADNYYSDDEK